MQLPILKTARRVSNLCKRDFGIFVPFLQKASDPIQQLFLDKLREFKAKSAGGKLVEPSPEIQKELQQNKERVNKQYGMKPEEDYKKFPNFKFKEPTIENPGY